MKHALTVPFALTLLASLPAAGDDFLERVEHLYADSQGVKIHYARLGDAKPLVVMIHGFPDFWYTWRHQMEALAYDHTVVAMDQRGYNLSDHPTGVQNYAMGLLIQDVLAVIRNEGRESAILVGHDWGAAVAWQVALGFPDAVERLVILSVPHPAGFGRELSSNASQQADSQYARDFQRPDSHESLTAEGLASWVRSPAERALYVEAFERSDFEAMMNYYRSNYPSSTGTASAANAIASPSTPPTYPKIRCPVLVMHGLKDSALHASGHNGTWDWVDAETTLFMLPEAGHFLQHDQPERVTATLIDWLAR